uniref:ABC transporter substrate-binding protein n=1 Tax=Clostridium sp. NkU-1 TaxID=1095009 RepID=UPI000A3E09AE
MIKHRYGLAAALVLSAMVMSGCGKAAGTQEGKQAQAVTKSAEADNAGKKDGVVVVMNVSSEPEAGFDPAYGWGAGEHVHEPLIQSTLTVTDKDLKIGYDLATDLTVSSDGLTWTVKIRDDVFFTDGEKLTGQDVAFTYNTLRDTSSVNDFTMLDRAEAIDNTTVVFHMKHPYSIWPYTMAVTGIVPEHAYGPDYGEHPIGSGRYILKQWDRGQQVILEANPDYYGEAPKMKKVTVLFMEEDGALAAVQSGQADIGYTAASYTDLTVPGYGLLDCKTVDNRGFNLPAIPSGSISEEGVPLGNDFTSDVRVRRAINIGIDREEMINNVLNGYGSPAYSVCDKMPWYEPSAKTEYDPEGAGALLDEAGWIMGSDGIRVKDGKRAELHFLYTAGDSVRQALAADTINQLKKLGIDGQMEGAGWDTAYDKAQSQPLIWGWGAHTPMELYNIYHTMEETGLASYSPYASQKVNQYMDEALAESDLEKSYELWKKSTVGWGNRHYPERRYSLDMACEYRSFILGKGWIKGCGSEASSPWARLDYC